MTPKEGLLAILKDKPDLVLCDIRMPIMSGFEVLERLTETAPHLGRAPYPRRGSSSANSLW